MQLGGDQRGQSIQIGAIILFGALIILLSTYQAFVVPNQNQEVEFKHNQQVQNDMKELRSALVSAADGERSSVSVQLGTEYPSRAIFVNPGPPSGRLRTVGTTNQSINATVRNASVSGDIGDFWNGDPRNYSTGELVYAPNYNVYQNPPRTVYSNTVLYNRFGEENLTVTDQTLVDGRSISLVALNGSLSAGRSGSVSVDVRPRSASQTRVAVTNASKDQNVTLELPTRLSEPTWERLLSEENVTNGGHVYDVNVTQLPDSRFDELVIRLERGVTYDLKLSKVAVGSARGNDPPASYLVKTRGNGTVVPEGEQTTVEVQARDKYNNPVSGEVVRADAERGGFVNGEDTAKTGSDGTATFIYDAPDSVSGSVSETINVSLDTDAHKASKPGDVSFSLTISGGGSGNSSGAYTVSWKEPTDTEVSSCPTVPPQGECAVGSSDMFIFDLNLTMESYPTVDGADVTYSVSNRSDLYLGENSGITDGNGENATYVMPLSNGAEYVYTSSGSDGDRLKLDVTTDDDRPAKAKDPGNTGTQSGVRFNVTNDANRTLTVTDIWVDPQNNAVDSLDDPIAGEGRWASEFHFEVGGDTYTSDFVNGENIPFLFDLSEGGNAGEEPVIGPGEKMTVYMYQFRSGGSEFNMSGERVNMSFTFSNGMTKNFTVNVTADDTASSQTTADIIEPAGGVSADVEGTGSLTFDIENTGSSSGTIEEVSVTVPSSGGSSFTRIQETEDNVGEFEIVGGGDNGDWDDGYFGNNEYTLGQTITLDDFATIDPGNTASFEIRYFSNNGGAKDIAGETVNVTVTYSDGSSETFSINA